MSNPDQIQPSTGRLTGRILFDRKYDRELRVVGFRSGGEIVSLSDEETGRPSLMTRSDVAVLENELEDAGLVTAEERLTCRSCDAWSLRCSDLPRPEYRGALIDLRSDLRRGEAA